MKSFHLKSNGEYKFSLAQNATIATTTTKEIIRLSLPIVTQEWDDKDKPWGSLQLAVIKLGTHCYLNCRNLSKKNYGRCHPVTRRTVH
ncbi:hypothetical protein [Cyanobacterium sp. uoEpiScrs1]|uniref:hypothetical protein n=1 Tax=Cyanobacterium sp. uoEpiScrs1 TaxID=2976343 RepID=UPI00226A147B|nr:hypothetical protein [Cyanobacterium sp. uoEpiScrs1]